MADETAVAPEVSEKVQGILDAVAQLTLVEASELVKAFEEKFGVTAAAPAMAMVAPGAGAGVAEEEEEKTTFDVVLADIGQEKISVIKAVKAITGVGLKEAKELVENAPKTLKEGVSKDEAEKIKSQIEETGATCEIK